MAGGAVTGVGLSACDDVHRLVVSLVGCAGGDVGREIAGAGVRSVKCNQAGQHGDTAKPAGQAGHGGLPKVARSGGGVLLGAGGLWTAHTRILVATAASGLRGCSGRFAQVGPSVITESFASVKKTHTGMRTFAFDSSFHALASFGRIARLRPSRSGFFQSRDIP